ncbi:MULTISPECIES: hypothetical protein [Rhodococcus]|jgi:hypothetical protein|uniref:Uncharacterized protein n=2 Tax=Rhodococcus TaxID=1827 RepID=A0A1H4LL77_9NOCA|nr:MULTISPECIES: hypothetical protein [Rhodococcus]SEB71480.1 hypothetical protein SAMN04490239_1350 [Rhodococcus koreensis]
MALFSTLDVLTRDHDGDLPTVRLPKPLLMRTVRLVENTADLVHRGCTLPPDVAEDVRPVTVFVVPFRGTAVAMFRMTSCPCLSNDPGVVSPNLVASMDR